MSANEVIVTHGSIAGYFKEHLDRLCARRRLALTEDAGFYVVNLLAEFAKAERLFLPDEEARGRDLVPLAELMSRALEASLEERVKLLKHLGDSSLYIGGFFRESLDRRNVDVGYYVSMGGGAYAQLSSLTAHGSQGDRASVFAELGRAFQGLVEVLGELAAMHGALADSSRAVLRLYDRWLRTGSPREEAMLRLQGVIPAGGLRN
jgi:hypothetical protein